MAYGLLSTGFFPKTNEVLVTEITAAWRLAFGQSTAAAGSPDAKLIAILAAALAELWELGEAINSSQDPDSATGSGLEALAALTGTLKEAATSSTVSLFCTGTVGTPIPSGSRARVEGATVSFVTTEEATLIACPAWTITTAYTLGQVRTNAARIYVCITAGTSAGAGGPTTTDTDITDGTVHWRYIGEGAGIIAAPAEAESTGATVAVTYDITEIVTPVGGWQSVINLADAEVGSPVESDEDLRIRRETELAAGGTAPADAIRADLLQVTDVTAVRVFYNDTDFTDADGVPPHSVECLVLDGADQDIFDQLFASVGAGIRTYGTESGTVVDSEGTSHTIMFSRPTEVLIYADVVLEYDEDSETYSDDAVKLAIVTDGNAISVIGKNAVASRVMKSCFDVDDVTDVTDVDIDDAAAPPNGTTVQIGAREIARWDTSRITVSSTAVTP